MTADGTLTAGKGQSWVGKAYQAAKEHLGYSGYGAGVDYSVPKRKNTASVSVIKDGRSSSGSKTTSTTRKSGYSTVVTAVGGSGSSSGSSRRSGGSSQKSTGFIYVGGSGGSSRRSGGTVRIKKPKVKKKYTDTETGITTITEVGGDTKKIMKSQKTGPAYDQNIRVVEKAGQRWLLSMPKQSIEQTIVPSNPQGLVLQDRPYSTEYMGVYDPKYAPQTTGGTIRGKNDIGVLDGSAVTDNVVRVEDSQPTAFQQLGKLLSGTTKETKETKSDTSYPSLPGTYEPAAKRSGFNKLIGKLETGFVKTASRGKYSSVEEWKIRRGEKIIPALKGEWSLPMYPGSMIPVPDKRKIKGIFETANEPDRIVTSWARSGVIYYDDKSRAMTVSGILDSLIKGARERSTQAHLKSDLSRESILRRFPALDSAPNIKNNVYNRKNSQILKTFDDAVITNHTKKSENKFIKLSKDLFEAGKGLGFGVSATALSAVKYVIENPVKSAVFFKVGGKVLTATSSVKYVKRAVSPAVIGGTFYSGYKSGGATQAIEETTLMGSGIALNKLRQAKLNKILDTPDSLKFKSRQYTTAKDGIFLDLDIVDINVPAGKAKVPSGRFSWLKRTQAEPTVRTGWLKGKNYEQVFVRPTSTGTQYSTIRRKIGGRDYYIRTVTDDAGQSLAKVFKDDKLIKSYRYKDTPDIGFLEPRQKAKSIYKVESDKALLEATQKLSTQDSVIMSKKPRYNYDITGAELESSIFSGKAVTPQITKVSRITGLNLETGKIQRTPLSLFIKEPKLKFVDGMPTNPPSSLTIKNNIITEYMRPLYASKQISRLKQVSGGTISKFKKPNVIQNMFASKRAQLDPRLSQTFIDVNTPGSKRKITETMIFQLPRTFKDNMFVPFLRKTQTKYESIYPQSSFNPKQISREESILRQSRAINMAFAPLPMTSQVSRLADQLRPDTMLRNIPKISERETAIRKSLIRQEIIQSQLPKNILRAFTAQKQILMSKQQPSLLQKQFMMFQSPRQPAPRQPPPLPPIFVPKPRPPTVEAFYSLVKRGGKWKLATDNPMSKLNALSYGARYVEQTPGASFQVISAGRKIRKRERDVYFLKNLFKYYSKKKAFIERTKYRISTKGELAGITKKGQEALKRKRQLLSMGQNYKQQAVSKLLFG